MITVKNPGIEGGNDAAYQFLLIKLLRMYVSSKINIKSYLWMIYSNQLLK
jgi:hypothetical protein